MGHDSCSACLAAYTARFRARWIRIMVSVWWLLWAFIVGGYAGMLLIALLVVMRKPGARDSVLE